MLTASWSVFFHGSGVYEECNVVAGESTGHSSGAGPEDSELSIVAESFDRSLPISMACASIVQTSNTNTLRSN